MDILKDMNIGTHLEIGFTVLVGLVLAVGLVATSNMKIETNPGAAQRSPLGSLQNSALSTLDRWLAGW